ncbi:MAG: FtsX-like permease family protein [Phycisphaeraceae bacterium]
MPQSAPGVDDGAAQYLTDLKELTKASHRLAGSPEGRAAGDYILKRLADMGIKDVMTLDFPVWQTRVDKCQLTVQGRTIELLPVRPNVVVPPVTSPQGFSGPLLYVGKGEYADYGDRNAKGAIVVLDYDSRDNWRLAFTLGAQAVVFLGDQATTPVDLKSAVVPTNLVRLYAPRDALGDVDLAGLGSDPRQVQATVVSQVRWEKMTGRNILAYLPGTQPLFTGQVTSEPQLLVLGAHYDTFGVVPHHSPGARGAANVAALLETASYFAQNPDHRRGMVILFLDNQARYHEGARYFYTWLEQDSVQSARMRAQHADEHAFLTTTISKLEEMSPQSAASRSTVGSPWYVVLLYIALMTVGVGAAALVLAWLAQNSRTAGIAIAATLGVVVVGGVVWYQLQEKPTAEASASTVISLVQLLEREADYLRADANQGTLQGRMRRDALHKAGQGHTGEALAIDAGIDQSVRRVEGWDLVRRALHERQFQDVDEQLFGELKEATTRRLNRRLAEVAQRLTMDDQRIAMRKMLGEVWVALHVTYDFSDRGPGWGLVAGEWTERAYKDTDTQGDVPGYYKDVLRAFRDARPAAGALPLLSTDTLTETTIASQYVPGRYVSGGMVAGTFGIYNVGLMTSFDARPRDGHPADILDNLDAPVILAQAREAQRLIHQADNLDPGLSLVRVFRVYEKSKFPTWSGGKGSGDFAGLQITGSLEEDRPASSALLAITPRGMSIKNADWASLNEPMQLTAFDPLILSEVDGGGHFSLVGINHNLFANPAVLGVGFDDQGRVNAVSTGKDIHPGVLTGTLRVNLFPAIGHVLVTAQVETPKPALLKVLGAASDTAFRDTRSLYGQHGDVTFFYSSALQPPESVKVYQDAGPVLLNVTDDHPYGKGLPASELRTPVEIDAYTAQDLYALNESRLAALRSRGVTSSELETLHNQARQALEQAQRATSVEARESLLKQSGALSRAVYTPLRQSMDDLVHAIVVLLLLAIPFAFALERLLLAATTIYQRLAGFAVAFFITFALLYFMHPGFAIASTPIIIFLAFTILLLSGLVIFIIIRKFRTELATMQGQGSAVHQAEVSRLGTLLAAVSMGMSTMRRRPTRTTLTAITVIMLTFTILCFASVSSQVGVRRINQGPANPDVAAAVTIRHLNYKALSPQMLTLLAGRQGVDGLLASQWWLIRNASSDDPMSVARPARIQGESIEGIMGVMPQELARWPQLAATLVGQDLQEKIKALQDKGVYLPPIIRDKLELKPGDPILFNGRPALFAGVIDSVNLQRLTQLEGYSALPIDPLDAASTAQEAGINTATEQDNEVERDFVHLSPDQIAIVSAELARDMGGDLRVINLYPGSGAQDPLDQGRQIAQMVSVPVWARGPQGVERMIFTKLTQVSGGMALVVPVVLGGLIIFGTLLGSISDREKEIYTFSALGLAPGHVGFLFFAEAAVYAVVGGMGGQLLAQIVALLWTWAANQGWVTSPSINYSSTNSLFAIGLVMTTVLVSAIYPAYRASKSANPGLARSWRLPKPDGDDLAMTFPFTVSAYDITGVISFLAEHFRAHNDAGLGKFAAQEVAIGKEDVTGYLALEAHLALAPFDLGVTQGFRLTAKPSEIPGVDEVFIHTHRDSGAKGDWYRANRVFIRDLRRQFLLWRTLSAEVIESYRLRTLEELGGTGAANQQKQQG